MYDLWNLPDFDFPAGFDWGSATAGHQIEGGNCHAQRWREELTGAIIDPEGKVFPVEAPSGNACDSYHRYEEDAQLLQDLGHQVYRMSLEWARIEPEEGVFVQEELNHYRRVLESLRQRGIRVALTLCHFTVPQWFQDKGSFAKRENIGCFLRFCERVVPLYADYVDSWYVLNEFFGKGNLFSFHAIRAHAQARNLIRSYSSRPVTSAHAAVLHMAERPFDELDCLMARLADARENGVLLRAVRDGILAAPGMDAEECPEARHSMDFWGLNLYTRHMVDGRRADGEGRRHAGRQLRLIEQDFYLDEFYPEGMTAMVERFADRPIVISENGCAANDDRFRIVYIAMYLAAIHEAIQNGADVRGYLYWSLLDNYEWTSFKPRFGLVDVDFATFRRTPKPSAYFYRDLIAANGFRQQILRNYLDRMPSLGK